MVKGDVKFLLNQRVGKFVQKSNNTNLSFYYHLMQGDFFRSQLFANSSGGARQANISGDSIKKIKVPYPDLLTQSKIAEMINNELLILEGNNSLIKNYELKITNRITKIWGE